MSTREAILLHHESLNEDKRSTIVLLHGLGSSHNEFAPLLPHLTEYHLLLPDLPAHSASSHITPFTVPYAADRVADLIRTRAHNSKCHLVGFSAGGFVAVELASKYPELLDSLFVSGVYSLAAKWGWMVHIAPYTPVVERLAPDALQSSVERRTGLKIPPGLRAELAANSKVSMLKVAWKSLREFGGGKRVSVRALAVAGERQDDVEGVRKLGVLFRSGNDASRAVVVEGALHWWGLQRPELFAEAVLRWLEGRELPAELKALDTE